jgi:hypothetical protein
MDGEGSVRDHFSELAQDCFGPDATVTVGVERGSVILTVVVFGVWSF